MIPVPAQTPIADRYRLTELIAVGGMGEVWSARDSVLDRRVALKLLRSEYADNEEFRTRFRGEARAAASVSDPHVVEVYDYGEQQVEGNGCAAYLVMEYVDGPSLADVIRSGRGLSPRETADLLAQAGVGLQAAHERGLVHRDIKPANLLRTPDGSIKIADFGIARAADAVPLTRTGTIIGTAQYVSPEQANGQPATAASDIYSLGVVAYACLAGHPPFSEGPDVAVALAHSTQPPPPLPDYVPDGLRRLVMSMLAKSPDDRPSSARAVAEAAAALLRDGTFIAAPAPPPDTPTSAMPREGAAVDPYPVDADPGATAVLPPDEAVASTAGIVPSEAHGVAGRQHRRLLIGGVVAALVLVGAGLAAAFATAGGPGTVAVPSLHGDRLAAARHALQARGFKVTVKRKDVAGKPAGVVTAQRPAAGASVDHGSRVRLTVATGTVKLASGAYVGRTYAAAAKALTHLGLTAHRVDQPSSQPSGTVIGIAPTGEVRTDATVTVTVATPLPAAPVTPAKPAQPHVPPGHIKHGWGGQNGPGGR
ncbi:MAG TPA: protein kinase [Mycobacteriales bacterium]|nr:protein kinase [Mycobacteriales bacterium]